MNSIRFKIENKEKFQEWLLKFKELGILGNFIPIGTSVDCGCEVSKIKFDNEDGEDSMIEFSISLEDDFLVKNYPKSFNYKNVLVAITTQWDINAGDVGEFISNEENLIDNIKLLMLDAV
jgi:hypothetical protein